MEYDREIAKEEVEESFEGVDGSKCPLPEYHERGTIELVRITFKRSHRDRRDHYAHEVRRNGAVVEVSFPDGSGTFEAAWEEGGSAAAASSFYYGMVAALA